MHVKTDEENFDRDIKSMALLNTNKRELELHKMRRKKFSEYNEINTKVEEMQSEMSEIKQILSLVLEKMNNV